MKNKYIIKFHIEAYIKNRYPHLQESDEAEWQRLKNEAYESMMIFFKKNPNKFMILENDTQHPDWFEYLKIYEIEEGREVEIIATEFGAFKEPPSKPKKDISEQEALILEALVGMWNQYCPPPWTHSFMSAGELAEEVLDRYNLLRTDETAIHIEDDDAPENFKKHLGKNPY